MLFHPNAPELSKHGRSTCVVTRLKRIAMNLMGKAPYVLGWKTPSLELYKRTAARFILRPTVRYRPVASIYDFLNADMVRHYTHPFLASGAAVTPAQGSVKPTAGFAFN
jgi:hypothetical protein